MTELFIFGSAVFVLFAAAVIGGIELHDWLGGRREANREGAVVRLWKEHNLVPDDMLTLQESLDLEAWVETVELSGDAEWIADGLEMLSIHSTMEQKRDVRAWDEPA